MHIRIPSFRIACHAAPPRNQAHHIWIDRADECGLLRRAFFKRTWKPVRGTGARFYNEWSNLSVRHEAKIRRSSLQCWKVAMAHSFCLIFDARPACRRAGAPHNNNSVRNHAQLLHAEYGCAGVHAVSMQRRTQTRRTKNMHNHKKDTLNPSA